jgi:hypothetical protein
LSCVTATALSLTAGCTMAADPAAEQAAGATGHVVFESVRRIADDGRVLGTRQRGDLLPAVALRAGRPWAFFDEPVGYDDEAWSVGSDDGTTESGYRVLRAANRPPIVHAQVSGGATVGAALARRMTAMAASDRVSVMLVLRGVPRWTIPLRADYARSAVDLAQAADERAAALRDRKAQIHALGDGPAAQIEQLGGRIVGRGRYGGWLTAELPAVAIDALAQRTDVARLELGEGRVEPAGIRLGDVRGQPFIDGDRFLAAGYTGERSNPTRHSYGDITIGVIEPGSLEDEACFLYDGADCTGPSRLRERFQCDDADSDGNWCEPVANLADLDDSSVTHGTIVTSIIAADYTQGQGETQQLGDAAWTAATGHSETWRQRATGIAPEASIVFFGPHGGGGGAASYADSFDDAVDRALDITNSSWVFNGNGSSNCNMHAIGPHEMELEDAFDDGILNVVAAGNSNEDDDAVAVCNIGSPADIPKALAVNAVDGRPAACQADYNDCVLDTDSSSTGGMDAEIDGTIYPGVISGVDLVAPTWINDATSGSGSFGSVGGVWNGTSMAAPVVAGAAALVKDFYLANGNTWINLPGRLQAVMLSMGDRHAASWKGPVTTQKTSGADRLWGVGKLKLRLLENGQGMGPWGNHVRTTSFAPATADVVYVPFGSPIPDGAVVVKCVMMQSEDMSSKQDISKIDLVMRLRQPVNGACSVGGGAVTATRSDQSRDLKKMGAIEDSQATLGNRCLEVTLENDHVTASGITTNTVCYYAGIDDDQ